MRTALPLLVLSMAATAAAEAPSLSAPMFERKPWMAIALPAAGSPATERKPVIVTPGPELGMPSQGLDRTPQTSPDGQLTCRDRIETVREERGLPKLKRDDATADEPLLIAAVDHRIGGCSMMVMYKDTSDVRPVPTAPGRPQVRRIQ